MDFVVFEANKYGLRVILSLENNYVTFGGNPNMYNGLAMLDIISTLMSTHDTTLGKTLSTTFFT